jgi:restriction endonuclease Mrr
LVNSELPDLLSFLGVLTKERQETYPIRIARKKALEIIKKMWSSCDPRVVFEDFERELRRPQIFDNWSVLFSPYSDSILLEYIPEWSQIERAVDIRKTNLRQSLAENVRALSPTSFAIFLANLFSRVEWANDVRVGKVSRDGGVDFSGYYVYPSQGRVPLFGQAKHWKAKVGSVPVSHFIGSVSTKSKGKPCVGIFVAESGFTADARRPIRDSPFKLFTFDTKSLIDLMIESNVGVKPARLEGLRFDESFWEEIGS